MPTETEICNLALSHVGVGKEIAMLEERSQEAAACRRFYHTAREATLRDFPWPFAAKYAALSLVGESSPGPGCTVPPLNLPLFPIMQSRKLYAYQYPSDCLHFVRILHELFRETRQSRIPYIIVNGAAGKLIYTERPFAWGEYTVDVPTSALFTADFAMALSFRIAMYIAPRLTSGDPYKLGDRAAQMYMQEITRAQATAVNEEQMPQDPDSEFIRGRND